MADNIITTNITANADFTGLRAQLAAVTAQLVRLQETTAGTNSKLANQIAVMNKAFATTLTSTGQFSQHFVSLSSDVDKFGKNLDRGRLKLNDYYKAWSGHTKRTSSLIRDLAKQQVMLEQAIVQPIGKNAQGLMQYNVMVAKGLDEIKNKMAIARQEAAIMNKVMLDGSNQLINWGKNTQWAGRQLTVGLTVPLIAFGAAAQKAFREADAELVRLTKVYGGLSATSAADLAQVRKDVSATAREIAGAYGIAYKETIALAADLAATGQEGNELLQATQQTTRLAVLGEVDRQEAMKATLAIQNAFKQNTDELAQSIDFLNAVENQTSTSLQDLVEAIPKAGPVVKSLGGDVKDLALYLTAMKEGGVNAAEGANAIKSAMASLINPTKVAKEMFFGFGIDIDKIVTSNAGNLTQTILDLQSALDNLDPLSKSRAIEQLFGKFQYARMSALFENLGKSGSQTLQVMDLMKASVSDLASISERELKMMTESASGQFKRAWASVQADLAAAGEQFLRISTKVLKVVDSIIKFFQKLPEPVKTFLNAIGGLTAIAGPLIMMAGVMGNFIGYVIKGIFHLRQLAKGGQGFKLLTPEIIAAEAAAKGLATTFYSDTEATIVLTNAVNTLADSFMTLETKANAAKVSVQPAISTVAGSVIMAAGAQPRVVDKEHPLVGEPYSRDMSHLIPSGVPQMGTIFGTVPGAKPVNIRVGKNPQAYMNGDLPLIPGLTSTSGGVSTGIVAQEAAKWHAMTAAISMQSEAEIKALKAEVLATGTVTSSLTDSYQALLPQFSEITDLAAQEVRAIVEEVKANKITVETARAKIIQLNANVEAMLAETTAMTAATMGRTANLTIVPLTSQPVVDPTTGKSNMKEMFHKGAIKELTDKIARALGGVKTSGAGYNIATTKPKLAKGGIVPGTGNTDTYHTTAEAGSFVINKASTEANMPIIENILGGKPIFRNSGGEVPVVLTPGEAVIPANFAQRNMSLMYELNGGPGNTSGLGRIRGGGLFMQRAATARKSFEAVARFFTAHNYERSHRSRQILNDAWALHSIYGKSKKRPNGMSRKEIINIAEAMDEEAFTAAHIDGKFSQAEYDAISQEQLIVWEKKLKQQYPDIELVDRRGPSRTRKNQSYGAPDIEERKLILDEMINDPDSRFDVETLSTIDPGHLGFDRAHTRPRDSWDTAGRYYLRNAIITDVTPNYASRQLEIYGVGKDLIPRKFSGALDINAQDIINERARILGFKDIDHYFDFLTKSRSGKAVKSPERFTEFLRAFGMSDPRQFKSILAQTEYAANIGGSVPGKFAQRLFGGGKAMFLGMPKTIKQVEAQRAAKAAMERAALAVKESRFAKKPVTEYGELLEPTSGRSFPVPGIGGVYLKGDEKVFVKPMLDETAALAEMRATEIAREVHGLHAPKQKVVVMKDPTDPTGKRKLLALESKYDPTLAATDPNFTTDQYFRQLVASALRGDKDLGRGNLSGNVLSDVGTAGVFATASGLRSYSGLMPSMKDQAMINLLGVKGSNAKRFFAEATADIPKGMSASEYHDRMLQEIEAALPKLKQTISRFDLNLEEKQVYQAMIDRLSDARKVNWSELHGVHSSVVPQSPKPLTPAAIAKMIAADELKRRQKGHAVSLSDNAFKTAENGFEIGGLIGALTKGKAMHRIGAGFGKDTTGNWGVTSLEIGMAEKLFGSTGLTKRTQKILYDKFAEALAKEMPYGYAKNAQGHLIKALEPDVMDSVIRMAASSTLSSREGRKVLSEIDRDILRKKYANWESKKDTPLTETLKQLIFKLEGREVGGPVSANTPYIVGEKGPEIFVPRNSGGIIPNSSSMAQGYNAGGLIKMMLMQMLGMYGGQALGRASGIPGGEMVGAFLGSMLGMGSMGGKAPKPLTQAGKWTRPIGSTTPVIGPALPGQSSAVTLTKYGSKIEAAAASTSKWKNVAAMAAKSLTRLNLAVAGVSLAVYIGKNRWDAYQESMRLNALGYGMTAEGAKKAGLKFTDYNKVLQDSVQKAKDIREQNQLLYQSMTNSGTPLNITIAEYKKLKKTVKEQFSDQIKLINKTDAEDQMYLAIRLKDQLIAMGMSAEEATKKIYTMYSLSKFSADAAIYTVQSKGFNDIKTAVDAAAEAIKIYNNAVKEGLDPTEQANAFKTAAMGIDTAVANAQEEAMKARKKDKKKPTYISGEEQSKINWDAEAAALDEITGKLQYQKTVSKETLDELKKTNPTLAEIADGQDTVVSLWQKAQLAARGYGGELLGLTAAQTNAVYQLQIAVSKSLEGVLRIGALKSQYKKLDELKALQEKYQKAMKGQSVAQQISDRDRLAALQKQIDANNKLADARIKALDAAKQEGDIAREIAKKQAEYDAALATGNTAAAQQASLDIQGLQSDLQYKSQVKAIEDARDLKNAPLLKQIEAIQKKQQDLGDAAALAGEKLGDVSKAIDKQESAINALITAMVNYRIAIDKHKQDLANWKNSPEAQGMLAAITSAATALKVDLSKFPVDSATGKPGTAAGQGLFDSIASTLETSLIKNGIVVNGDLIVNGKKVNLGGSLTTATGQQMAGTTTGSGSSKKYFNAAGEAITKNAYESLPKRVEKESGKAYVIADASLAHRMFDNFGDLTDAFKKKFDGKTSVYLAGNTYGVNGEVWSGTDKTAKPIGLWFNSTPGGKVKSFDIGGKVTGPGTGTSDSIPAYLSNGEYVIKEKAVKHYGVETFDALNAQKFHKGGSAGHRHGRNLPEKQNWFEKYVSDLSASSDAMPAWARDPLGVHALLRKIAGQGRKGDTFASALMPLNFMGMGIPGKLGLFGHATAAATTGARVSTGLSAATKAIKPIFSKVTPSLGEFGRAHLAGKLPEQAALHAAGELVDPVYANKVIMDKMHSGILEAAKARGARVPDTGTIKAADEFKDESVNLMTAGILTDSDLGVSLRTMWGAAFDEMLKAGSESIRGMSKRDFFLRLHRSSPGVATQYDDEAASLFVKESNLALLKTLGLRSDQPIAMYRSTPYASKKSAPGYYSLSERFAHEYGRQYTEAGGRFDFDPATGGMYKVDLSPTSFPSPIGMGGVADEFATVLGPVATAGAKRVASAKLSGAWVRGFPFAEYYESRQIKNFSSIRSKINAAIPSLLEKYPLLRQSHIQNILKKDEIADTATLDFSRLQDLFNSSLNNRIIGPNRHVELDQLIKLLEDLGDIAGQPIIAPRFAKGGYASGINIPKFDSGINMVPADMLAMLHKNEAVVPANMNPFNPNANNATIGGAVYNITNNINGYDGDLNQLSNLVTQKTITAINSLDSRTAKMNGPVMTVGVK